MSDTHPLLTTTVQQTIMAYIRSGGFPHIAAEAAGVPRAMFEKWLRLGRKQRAAEPYRCFAADVRKAAAQARLTAELAAFKGRPFDWLRSGPGKETARNPGWTATARAAPRRGGRGRNSVDGLVTALLEVLAPYPDARAAVAAALLPEGDSRGSERRSPASV
jgi:hypothetical protein